MTDVAIIGMACIFPGAPDLKTYWDNICRGVDAITDAPPERLDSLFFDESSTSPDRLYARRGGFIDEYATFDAASFGVMPVAATGAEPDQLLTLQVVQRALEDAGYSSRAFNRERTGIILGRGNYLGTGMVRLSNRVRAAEQLVLNLSELFPELSSERLAEVKAAFQSRSGPLAPDSAIGLVPNLIASRIANRMNLNGTAYTVDAACASSHVAVDQACREIEAGRAEMMIAGGVHLCHEPSFWSVMCQLGAVSHKQEIRPFDRRADGLLIGEGIGVLVLKDRQRAELDGDRIYAVIRGTGVSSDGRSASLMAPAVEGQLLALSRAWSESGLDPGTVGLIEAHGTATNAGDAAELETIERFFGGTAAPEERIALGSVKSMIGHTMPAAGAAGLIKTALAVYHGVLPPSIHCEEPRDELVNGHFEVLQTAKPWEAPVRRAGVNAFGFGGINGHVILESASARAVPVQAGTTVAPSDALVLAASTQAELLVLVDRGQSRVGEGPWRLAVFNPTPERIATARAAVERGVRRFGRDGIFFAPGGYLAAGGKLAFLFPGVEAVDAPDVTELANYLGVEPPVRRGDDVEGRGIFSAEISAMSDHALRSVGATPHVIAGHSIGEWSGMMSSGMLSADEVRSLLVTLGPGALEVLEVVFLAVGAGAEAVEPILEGLPGSVVSHDNCEHQSILCGPPDEIETVKARLREQRVLFEELPFRSGFHTPAYAPLIPHLSEPLAKLQLHRGTVPLWSATTCEPYPDTPEEISDLFVRHLVEPVRFRQLVHRLWDEGVRVFVQVGAGSLNAFVDDSLLEREHNAITTLGAQRGPIEQLRWAAAALFVEGANLELQKLGVALPVDGRARAMKVSLGAPLIHLGPPQPPSEESAVPTASPEAPAPLERSETRILSVDTNPELLDHSLLQVPPDWPEVADRLPVVPMTMSLMLMREAAEALLPGKVVVGFEKIVASSWLVVAPPVEVTITAKQVDEGRVSVTIGHYVRGTVLVADDYPPAAALTRKVKATDTILVTGEAIYRDRWLFHGPAYQGLVSVDASDPNGTRGTLVNLPAPGALLDAAGQLAGLWVMLKAETNRLAMPVKVERIEFFSADPPVHARVECEAVVRSLGQREFRSDITLWYENRLYCLVSMLEDWRFDTSGGLFDLMRHPERHLLAEVHPEGFVTVATRDQSLAALQSLASRFMPAAEVGEIRNQANARKRAEWLFGRIAAKDAVRSYLFDQGHGPVYPIEIGIDHDASGRPLVKSKIERDLRVSVAHTEGMAAAMALEGADPGIDIERIEARTENFGAIAFMPKELALLPDANRDEWMTRLWAAKEAAGKARGTGLQGSPRTLPLQDIKGTRMLIDGLWVSTRRIGEYVVAWTAQ